MEKSFHPSTPHLVSDLIEIGSHDDSHRRNLASLETISLIAFALRIRTWEKPSSSSSYLYIHRGVLSADRISIFLPSEILFNRLRNSNVARLEFRLVRCTSATSLHRNFSPPLLGGCESTPPAGTCSPVYTLLEFTFWDSNVGRVRLVCSSRARESFHSWIKNEKGESRYSAEEIRRDCLRLETRHRKSWRESGF